MVELYQAKDKELMLDSKYAEIKQKTKDLLVSAAEKFVSQIWLYAAMENDLITANLLNLKYDDLHSVPGDKLVDTCTKIADVADELGVKVADYNVTPAGITDFRTLIADFSKLLSSPRMDIAARAAIGTEMENIIKEIRAHLKDKMDKSMNSIKNNEPEYFNAYTSARVIIDLKGKRNVTKPVSDTTGMISGTLTDSETGEPIVNAIVQRKGSEEATTTDEDGVFMFDTVTPGMANIICIKELYVNLNLTDIEVKAGEETEVEGVMEKEGVVAPA